MLSQTAEHALRACLYLAQQPGGERVPAEVIADAVGAPRNYMGKTLNQLARRGILSSARGPKGGFRLEADPALLTLAELSDLFEAPATGPICLLGGVPCSDRTPCQAHRVWSAVKAQARRGFLETTIADLLAGRIPAGVGADSAVDDTRRTPAIERSERP
jgi:Rrf2 family protein